MSESLETTAEKQWRWVITGMRHCIDMVEQYAKPDGPRPVPSKWLDRFTEELRRFEVARLQLESINGN